jgi:MoaA/NifB/PqqE/SkfB family radical SAM enzyme
MVYALRRAFLKSALNLLLSSTPISGIADSFMKTRDRKVSVSTKRAFEAKALSMDYIKKSLRTLSPKCRKKFIENFIINSILVGKKYQFDLEKKYKMGLPWFFVLTPTAQCNLSCVGCYAHEYTKHKGLPYEEVDRILKEAKELGIHFITISGGEPFTWPYLFKMFREHNDMFFQIYTNGTLITPRVAKMLAKVGNAAPAISVEGFEAQTDKRRGQGIYTKILDAMDNLRKEGVLFGFSATPTKINSDILCSDSFIDLMIKKGCKFGWFFQYVPIGKKPDTRLMSSPEQRNRLRIKIQEIRANKPIFVGDFWNDGPFASGCMAGARPGGYFHINCNGDVEPCVFLQFSVDNIKGKKLIDVIRSPFFKAIRKEQPYCKSKNLLTPCALIDNPEILRKIVKKHGAKPSYNGGMAVINDPKVCRFLDKYSKQMHKMTEPIWDKELKEHFSHWKDDPAFFSAES